MNILLIIIGSIGALIALLLIVALFVNKDYEVKGQIVINKSKRDVFEYLRFLKNQDHYNQWVMVDPNMKKIFTGTDGAVGFVYAWDGNKKAGKGEQEIKKITDGERIDMELRFIEPFQDVAQAYLATESVSENQTRVTWGLCGTNAYPRNLMNIIMHGILSKSINGSLELMKNTLEKQAHHELTIA